MTVLSLEEIKRLVGMQLGTRDVRDNSLLVEDLSAESADVANIVAALEDKYHIVIKESEIAKIRTPIDLFELVNAKLPGK